MTEIEKTRFAATPAPPFYIVAFSSKRTDGDDGYAAMADQMEELALAQDGCLGVRERWHVRFEVRIARVERAYSFQSSQGEDVGQQIH